MNMKSHACCLKCRVKQLLYKCLQNKNIFLWCIWKHESQAAIHFRAKATKNDARFYLIILNTALINKILN